MLVRFLFSFFVLIGGYAQYVFSQEVVKTVKASKVAKAESPKIDGLFYDTEWLHGGKATGFIQMDPDEGEPASERTEAYFLYDNDNLYIGIKCFDNEPDKIINQRGSRDNAGVVDYM